MAYPGIAPLVVTGMHRSATSLVASLLHESGISMGTRLLQPGRGNLRGYFEDEDFVDFHDKALRDRGRGIFVDEPFRFEPTPEETAAAQRLIEARQALPTWGWKDPRTTLFLDFWASLLPDATFLLLYRHPLEILSSLVRRLEPMADWAQPLDAWRIYNEQLLAFREGHRPRSLICHGYAAVDQPEAVTQALVEKRGPGIAIEPRTRETVYRAEELKRLALPRDLIAAFSRLYPGVQSLYERLESTADVPAEAAQGDKASSSDLGPFFRLVAALPPGGESRYGRSGLHVLMTCLELEAGDAACRESRRVFDEVRARAPWLEEQRAFLLAESQRLEQALAEQGVWAEGLRQERLRLLALQEEWLAERASLLAHLDGLRQANASLDLQVADLRRRAEEAELALAELRSSLRWRITGPVWRLAGILAPPNSRRAALIRKLAGPRS